MNSMSVPRLEDTELWKYLKPGAGEDEKVGPPAEEPVDREHEKGRDPACGQYIGSGGHSCGR